MIEVDGRSRGMRILVVDDNQDTARMMELLLRSQGHDVALAFDGREAIGLAGSFRPDVVLLDLTLPDMRGEEVAEELGSAAGLEATTLVAISGYDVERLPPVFHAQFLKPVDHEVLNEYLAGLAGGGRVPGGDGTGTSSPLRG
jgi:CheY-like chemotaxis protein